MKRLIVVLLCISMVAALFSGCGSKTEPSVSASDSSGATTSEAPATTTGEEVTITWAIFETDNLTAEYYQNIIDAFEADNPGIKVETVLMTGDSRGQFLKTLLAAGNFPDVVVEAENLANIEGLFAEVPSEMLAKYDDATLVETNGAVRTIPAFKQYRMQCYYHKNVFESLGLNAPTTWDEFINVCQSIKDSGQTPLMGAGAADVWATGAPYWISVANQEIMSAYPNFNEDVLSGKVDWANETVSASMKRWQGLVDSGYYHKGSMSFGYSQASAEFKDGSAAMMIDGSWLAAGLDAESNDEIGCFPVPNFLDEKTYCAAVSYWGVYQESKNKEAAFQFVNYVLGGNMDVYKQYLSADGWASVTKEPVVYERGPLMTQFIGNWSDYTLVPEITKVVGDSAMPTGMEEYILKSMQNIFTGADVDAELQSWDTEFDRLLAAQS